MAGVLSGLVVLDLSKGIAGPMTTMLMADHGAHVTRILPPGGDRFSGQPGYKVWQRAKDAITLDLKNAAEREYFLKMADAADVVVESYKPGVTRRLGIDYATLKARNPRLIYVSITAYGADTKDAQRPGYDALVAARTGLHWEQRGWPEGCEAHMAQQEGFAPHIEIPYDWVQGPPRPGPVFPRSTWPSLGAFFSASLGMNAALRARGVTGKGQHVEATLLQGAMAAAWATWQRAEKPTSENGFPTWIFGSRSPKGHFKCADGRWIHQWVPNPRFLIGASENQDAGNLKVTEDPDRFGIGPEELIVMMQYQEDFVERVARFDTDYWLKAAAAANVPLQECRPVQETLTDPLLMEDGCVVELADPEMGPIRQVGVTYRLPACPSPITNRPHANAKRSPALSAMKKVGALNRPLEGIRVIDFGLAVAGPYGTQLLSDLGADVIKVNNLHDQYWHSASTAVACSRGKRSVALNLKAPQARDIVRRMVERSDIVQHNMRYAAATRLKLDYESLKAINPKLIYCHTRGFERGYREGLPGNDQTGAALAGIQYADGGMARGGKPMWTLCCFGDTGNGFLSAIGMIQALMHRDHTGEGQFVDTSIINASLLNTSYAFTRPDGTGPDFGNVDGMNFGLSALYRLYETADGWVCIAILTEAEWAGLCRGLEAPGLAGDARFATGEKRRVNDAALADTLAPLFRKRSAREWRDRLDQAGAPCEISDAGYPLRMFDDPELQARAWVAAFDHRRLGRFDMPGLCVSLSETPEVIQSPPLIVGDHTRAILTELGYDNRAVDELIAQKITFEAEPPGRLLSAGELASRR